jgi:ADP-heptose:LPS heptosyltransferase
LLKALDVVPVILGTQDDEICHEVVEGLSKMDREFFSGVGKWNLRETAVVLANSKGLLGADTGLAHLAEAVGVPVFTLFGPTKPDMGFGPWREESRAISKKIWPAKYSPSILPSTA